MKTTVELPDDLYRRAKAQAALSRRKLKDLVEEGLRTVVEAQSDSPPKRLADLMKKAQGVVRSGIPDLGSNPDHLSGSGRNARRHR